LTKKKESFFHNKKGATLFLRKRKKNTKREKTEKTEKKQRLVKGMKYGAKNLCKKNNLNIHFIL
jgi:hypothetical protein